MYVRKFESDSLEDALKDIKRELGPDAIILKTITNKGLKGAFKKKKIEITAAISEKNYTKKAKVDSVIPDDMKENFYSSNSDYIAKMMDRYGPSNSNNHEHGDRHQHQHEHQHMDREAGDYEFSEHGYGQLGLNRSVKSSNLKGQKPASGLDDFLSRPDLNREVNAKPMNQNARVNDSVMSTPAQTSYSEGSIDLIKAQNDKIYELEKKIYEFSKQLQAINDHGPHGLYQTAKILRGHGIAEAYIQRFIKKASFELNEEDLKDEELIFEFALRDMLTEVKVEMPLFSKLDRDDGGVITIFLSQGPSGQTSTIYKLATLKENSLIITNSKEGADLSLAKKMYNLKNVYAGSVAEMVSEARRGIEEGKAIFIDYKNMDKEKDETKNFIDGLRRAFSNVEVLININAINSEAYNKRVASKFRNISDGMVFSCLDLCIDYGSLFNLAEEYSDLPLKFYGTGPVIPDDIESATPERILSGIFNF